ncbi:DEAD-box ATP-dependent RNA helicase [Rhizoctonia solani AG-3 Rhs1AP]|uniref:ATP-dependent RNA helicase n=2 Tax=Rhizoctonia solani AG-3 TaxID=1086053 RepID=A0A074RQB9_9AGAM|nr:DEAD-box ATP-dependent RNA helicase [Rhizoctonia solani AG-3 Rhs1AP]KEP46883.1 DEAD-box ATP-dependent RNA helicase [Rhizoctonia solani 123E]
MSLTAEYDSSSARESNNPAPRPAQNKSQLLEATMRNVPKLKELNYTQWKNVITNSIKKAKLWGYVDGSIQEPSEHDANSLTTYFDEAAAVRNAILGSLEYGAQKYIEEALDPRDSWLALEKKYLTAEVEADAKLVSLEQQLANLKLEEGGDMVEHIADFCRMRSQLSGTRLAIDDQACISMLYRSLPPSFRQSVLTPEGIEMKEFSALCARLTYLSQNPEPEAPVNDTPPPSAEDYTNWGVPGDIKAFGLTGDKNPLLEERAVVTCRDCLLMDHKAGTPECPQYEWRKELWGTQAPIDAPGADGLGSVLSGERPPPVNAKRLNYEFSEPVKVILDFDELGLKPQLRQRLNHFSKPSAIQQCAILPVVDGRNVLAQAPSENGKTTALAISILQVINFALLQAQVLVFTSTSELATSFQKVVNTLGSGLSVRCYACDSANPLAVSRLAPLAAINDHHIFVGTPGYLLALIRRNIINMRKIRTVVLDDVDKLIEAGSEDQILEVYKYVPPLAQVVASSTSYSLSIAKAVTKLLANPLQILANRNEGIPSRTQFYVMVPVTQKPSVLYSSFGVLGVDGIALLCRDFTEITENNWEKTHGFYHLRESMPQNEWEGVVLNFTTKLRNIPGHKQHGRYANRYDPVSNVILATTDAALSAVRLPNAGVPLINYDVPSNVEDYVKRLDHWRLADPGRSQIVITFVAADTDEINIIQDLERYYGVHVAELLWDEGSKRLH